MATIFFNDCINTPSKRYECLQNKFFRYLFPFLLKSSLNRNNIWLESYNCFVF